MRKKKNFFLQLNKGERVCKRERERICHVRNEKNWDAMDRCNVMSETFNCSILINNY